jgi:arabinose-5-phosphate isomerase
MIDLICNTQGRVIVSGIGKSGLIGKKIVATLNSTGTRSFFLHPVEAMHGDLGQVSPNDLLLALSNSGETDELNLLVPSVRNIGCKVIAFTGNPQSTLARLSNIIINTGVEYEACPLGLAPTASTTAQLAMGDAMAAVLIERKNIRADDFKKYHPGGALGQRLKSMVSDFMVSGERLPTVPDTSTMVEAVEEINRKGLGATLVQDKRSRLIGIITDGDVRRAISKHDSVRNLPVKVVMTASPRTVGSASPAYDALNVMEKHQITVLPVTDGDGNLAGIIHLHDILGKGEFKFNGN